MDFWAKNKDAITTILAVLATLGTICVSIWAILKWGILRWWTNRIRTDVKVFELITDPAILLPRLYSTENDNSPLADHKIKYQPRDLEHDLQAELKAALNRSRYLLITAPTGYGKTREAGMLAQTMMLEGWRVLRIRTGWLDVPKTLPEELNGNRSRVLIFLDDLNGLFSTGNLTQSPRVENEKTLMLNQLSYHDRLLQMLNMFEGMCTKSEIRVIATARNEAEQWKVLEYNQRDRLWKRFERVELSEPVDTAIINLLEDATEEACIQGNKSDFAAIAHMSDGTYRNILLNLRRWRAQNKEINKNDFTETLDGSWRDIYDRAVKKHLAVKYIYDAMDVLEQAGIQLFLFWVEPTALMIWSKNYFQRFLRQGDIRRAIHYLTKETTILRHANGKLNPSDGQLEVGRDTISWTPYSQFLSQLLLNSPHNKTSSSIYGLAMSFYYEGQFQQALQLISKYTVKPLDSNFQTVLGILLGRLKQYEEAEVAYRKAIELDPSNAIVYLSLGNLLQNLKRYEEAEATYRKAIELNPSDTIAYFNLGISLRNLKRYEEAEVAYRKAIELDPADATAYFNLGILLRKLKRYEEAEAVYRKAIELDPADANAYNNLGNALQDLKRYEEAEVAYRKAIGLDPADATVYFNLGYVLRVINRAKEALPLLEKMIEINPDNFNAYLGIASIKKTLGEPIESLLVEKARQYIPEDDFYNRACLESVCDHFDMAFEYLYKASQKEKFNPKWVWEDPDLEWIRNDPRFVEIVGMPPDLTVLD